MAWTTWFSEHKLRLATRHGGRLVQAEASSPRAQLCCELQEAWERRDHSMMWRSVRKLEGKRNGPKIDFSMCRRRSDPAVQIGEVSCSVHVKMEGVKE